MTQQHATVQDAQEAARDWSDEFLECRTYGHTWRPSVAAYSRDRRTIDTVQVCPRCTSERRATLDARTGWVVTSHIAYAEGYLTKGMGRITGDAKGALRLAVVGRSYGLRVTRIRAS